MPLALDTVAGDPVRVAGVARVMAAIADDVSRQAAALRSLANSPSCWSGKAAARAQTRSATLPPKLDKVTASYRGAGQALFDYAHALADALQRSRAAIAAAQRADDDLRAARQAQAAAAHADAEAAAAARATCQLAPPPTAPRYQGAIDDASSRLARAVAANDDAHTAQKAAAARAANTIKAASRQGIHNQSWWHHVTNSVGSWTSSRWQTVLADVAAVAGKLSMLATVAAVVLAIGGMFFPPLEALAAAAESEAVVFGAISAATATTVELSLKQTRDKGMVSLAFFAMPPAAKSLQRLIPIQVMDPGRTAIVDDATLAQDGANGLAIGDTATTQSVPLGFDDVQQYDAFGRLLHAGTEERYPATVGIMQGSSVTGVSYKTGLPFDEGRVSDYDVALAGSDIFAAARQSGVKARGGGIRTGPLHAKTVAKLGLRQLQRNLSAQSGRPTKFMIYRSVEEAMSDKPSIRITP